MKDLMIALLFLILISFFYYYLASIGNPTLMWLLDLVGVDYG